PSQVKARPASTQAPEKFLEQGLKRLGQVLFEKLGIAAIQPHGDIPALLKSAHRFRATDRPSLLALAKDLARLTADSFEATAIQKHVKPPKGERWGSLKSLENLLATQVGAESAHSVMGPLFGIYDLRLADAHLPSSEVDATLAMVGI